MYIIIITILYTLKIARENAFVTHSRRLTATQGDLPWHRRVRWEPGQPSMGSREVLWNGKHWSKCRMIRQKSPEWRTGGWWWRCLFISKFTNMYVYKWFYLYFIIFLYLFRFNFGSNFSWQPDIQSPSWVLEANSLPGPMGLPALSEWTSMEDAGSNWKQCSPSFRVLQCWLDLVTVWWIQTLISHNDVDTCQTRLY